VWRLLDATPAWDGNGTHDSMIVFAWELSAAEPAVIAVNYAGAQSQCHVRLPFANLNGKKWQLRDLLSNSAYDWNGNDLLHRGLFLDMKPWQAQVFLLQECP
jgi:hypothetical protein